MRQNQTIAINATSFSLFEPNGGIVYYTNSNVIDLLPLCCVPFGNSHSQISILNQLSFLSCCKTPSSFSPFSDFFFLRVNLEIVGFKSSHHCHFFYTQNSSMNYYFENHLIVGDGSVKSGGSDHRFSLIHFKIMLCDYIAFLFLCVPQAE